MAWFVYGLVLGACIMRVGIWEAEGKLIVSWYAWCMGFAAILLATLAIQHFFASRKELEFRAAWMGLVLLGLPAAILAVIVSCIIATSQRA